jgi:hypothetical protein
MTKSKRISSLLIALVLTAEALGAERQKFIPWSPLNEDEAASLKAKLERGGMLHVELDQLLKDVEQHHTYREADIFKAYPELRGFEKLSECSNSMMSGATALVFLSSRRKNEVTLETVSCSRATKGVNCGAVKLETRYFLDGTDRYFLLDGVTFAKATELLALLNAGLITGLPNWMPTVPTNISLIKETPDDVYQLIFGDFLCAGCVSKINVKLEGNDGQKRLVVVDQPETMCI